MYENPASIPPGTRRLMAAACSGMFVFGIVMAILGAILPNLFAKIGFDMGAAGTLFLTMNSAMLVMTLLFGPLVDRFGFKVLLVESAGLVALAFALMSLAWVRSSYGLSLAAAGVLGFGGGGLNGGANALTSDIHDAEKRGPAMNLLGVFFGFGALTIPFLIGTLLEALGIFWILLLAAVLGLATSVFFGVLRFPPAKQAQGFPIKDAARVARDPLLWLCAFLLFFQSGNEFTVGGWISTHLQRTFGMAPAAAALVLAGYWAAIMAGRFVSSRVLRALGPSRLVLASAILALAAALLLRGAPSAAPAAAGAILIGLGFAAIYPTTLAVVGERFAAFTGTAFGVVISVGLAGGMLAPWLAGRIARGSGLRQGLFLPVAGCAMIIVLQILVARAVRKRRTA